MVVLDRQLFMRRVRHLGQRDAHFTFAQVRDAYGGDHADRDSRRRLWYWWKQLERDGVIKQVPGKRRRNRYYRIADEQQLDAQMSGNGGSAGVAAGERGAAAGLMSRLEQRVTSIENQLTHIDRKLDQLLSLWV